MRLAVRTVSVVAAIVALTPYAHAQSPAPETVVPNRVLRPMALPTGALEVHFGTGVASSRFAGGGRATVGAGLHGEVVVGLGRHFEIDGGLGLRVGGDAELLAADRYARVAREEVYQVGNRLVGNPYARARFAIFDRPTLPLRLGVEAMLLFPLAQNTDWSLGFGIPAHVILAQRVRVESGAFAQFIPSPGSTLRNVVNVPLRVHVAITERFLAGITTGLSWANVGTNDPSVLYVPFGVQIVVRIQRRTDLTAQWLYPAATPLGTDALGFGLGLIAHRW